MSAKNNASRIAAEIETAVLEFLKCFPTVNSHYRRKYTNKRYFEAGLNPTIMFRLFKDKHPDLQISVTSFRTILQRFDINFMFLRMINVHFTRSMKTPIRPMRMLKTLRNIWLEWKLHGNVWSGIQLEHAVTRSLSVL